MRRMRLSSTLLIITSLLAFLASGGMAAAAELPTPGVTGYAQIPGDVLVELFLSPPITAPGERITANFVVTNRSRQPVTPLVEIPLPANLELNLGILPAATSFDLINNQITWQPVVQPDGGQQTMSLPFRVGAADLSAPEREFRLNLVTAKETLTAAASYWVGLPPTAAILVNPMQPAVGQPVQLLARIEGSGPFVQVWQTGDQRELEAVDPVVVYPVAGQYQVTLHVANPLAATRVTAVIDVVEAPTAAFALDDPTPAAGQIIHFTNLSGGAPPLQFLWDFGDGQTSSEREPAHQYATPGEYKISLTVQNAGSRAAFVWPLTVGVLPQAQLLLPAEAMAGETVVGQAAGDSTVDSYAWDMGDGHVYEGSAVNHVYWTGGDHYVTMTARSEYGETQVGQWIRIALDRGHTVFLPLLSYETAPSEAVAVAAASPANVISISAERSYEPFEPIQLEPAPLLETATAAEQLLWYVNEARRLHNLPPLAYVYEMSIAAQRHAEDMAVNQFTGHTGSDGSRPFERLQQYGFDGDYGGEATAWGLDNARQVVEFWVNSPPHRRIILNERAITLGVGYVLDFASPNVWYWVTEFGQTPAPVALDEGE